MKQSPKEKARELVQSHMTIIDDPLSYEGERMEYSRLLEKSKRAALVTTEEIIRYIDSEFQGFLDTDTISWWNAVKKEIEVK